MVYPELRSVFYWRLGKWPKLVFFWMPGRINLHLVTNPQNVEGGFYVGHGWGTVVNAQRIGKNFRVIGNNSQVGAGAIVVKSVPENSVVVSSKSMVIKQNGERVNIPL